MQTENNKKNHEEYCIYDFLHNISIDILFESPDHLKAALQAGGQAVTADVSNYTDVQPTMAFGNIELSVP